MGYKKHNWMRYGSSDQIIIEVRLKEGIQRGDLDFFRCNNKEDFKKILKILKTKYGLG